MKEFLEKKIVSTHQEYTDLDAIIKEKNVELEAKRLKIKDGGGENLEEKIEFIKEANVDLFLFSTDLKVKFDRLFFLINLYNELGYEGLPESVLTFYKTYKAYSPTEIFIIKDGNLLEKEEGSLEKARQSFIDNNEFMKQLLGSAK